MGDLLEDFKKYVDESSWDDIAKMAKTYSLEFSSDEGEVLRIKKQIKITKELLHEYLTHEDKKALKNPKFFTGLVKSIEMFEKTIETHEAKKSEFLMFLRALLGKIKKEKLKVHKPMERRMDFAKLKEVGE